MSKEKISVSMEEKWLQRFGKVVGHVDGSVNLIKEDEIAFDSFTQ
jgi:hypothetical protein